MQAENGVLPPNVLFREEVGPRLLAGQHGSWNRTPRSGDKMILVLFAAGKPAGMAVDVGNVIWRVAAQR